MLQKCKSVSKRCFLDIVHELLHPLQIVPYLKKFGRNPATGEPLATKDLIRLHFHRNSEGNLECTRSFSLPDGIRPGKYHCPLTFKVFNENSHIVAITKSGNVFSYEAVKELNLLPKCFTDQITGEAFRKKDIVVIQVRIFVISAFC